jgi:hypothetical protein
MKAIPADPAPHDLAGVPTLLSLRQSNMSGLVIPAEAGIQAGAGCRIESGMTALAYLDVGLMISGTIQSN